MPYPTDIKPGDIEVFTNAMNAEGVSDVAIVVGKPVPDSDGMQIKVSATKPDGRPANYAVRLLEEPDLTWCLDTILAQAKEEVNG